MLELCCHSNLADELGWEHAQPDQQHLAGGVLCQGVVGTVSACCGIRQGPTAPAHQAMEGAVPPPTILQPLAKRVWKLCSDVSQEHQGLHAECIRRIHQQQIV